MAGKLKYYLTVAMLFFVGLLLMAPQTGYSSG